jgi:hypothetical protein
MGINSSILVSLTMGRIALTSAIGDHEVCGQDDKRTHRY